MREIKFRGKCLTKDGWAYGMPLASRFGCSYMITKQGQLRADFIYSRHTIMDIDEAIAVDTETVGQYTGLKDKNGVEIYEGDIFRYHAHRGYTLPDFTGHVIFENGTFGFIIDPPFNGEMIKYFSDIDELKEDFLDHIEIIGNIHDIK